MLGKDRGDGIVGYALPSKEVAHHGREKILTWAASAEEKAQLAAELHRLALHLTVGLSATLPTPRRRDRA
jgi:hypothetical protein